VDKLGSTIYARKYALRASITKSLFILTIGDDGWYNANRGVCCDCDDDWYDDRYDCDDHTQFESLVAASQSRGALLVVVADDTAS